MNTEESAKVVPIPDLTQMDTPGGRFYHTPNGSSYPSVTTVLNIVDKSAALTKWAAKLERDLVMDTAVTAYGQLSAGAMPNAYEFRHALQAALPIEMAHKTALVTAGGIGSEVHNRIEAYLNGVPYDRPLSHSAQRAFEEFREWWQKTVYEPVVIEGRVVSEKHGYAGTTDLLVQASTAGHPVIIDFKTSKWISWTYFLQLAAYREALVEMGHPRADTGFIIKLPKELGKRLEVVPVPDLDTHFQSFLHALHLYNAQQAGDPWMRRRLGN